MLKLNDSYLKNTKHSNILKFVIEAGFNNYKKKKKKKKIQISRELSQILPSSVATEAN